MKNKLKICLCTLALALGLMACGGQKDDTLGGRTEADYQSELSSMLTQLSTLDEAAIDYNISYISSYSL